MVYNNGDFPPPIRVLLLRFSILNFDPDLPLFYTSKRHRSNVWIFLLLFLTKNENSLRSKRIGSHARMPFASRGNFVCFSLCNAIRAGTANIKKSAEKFFLFFFIEKLTKSIGIFQQRWADLSRWELVQSTPCRYMEVWQLVVQFRSFQPILRYWCLSKLDRSLNLYSLVIMKNN